MAWALAWVLVAGCADDALTELVVTVDSDLTIPWELRSVRLRVVGPSGDTALDQSVDLTAPGAPRLPLTLSLTPGSDALAPVAITAAGTGPAGSVERSIETGFVRGERRAVLLPLLRACVDVTCPMGETCTEGGTCIDAAVPPESLPPFTGEPGGFDAGPATDADLDGATDAHAPTDAPVATDALADRAAEDAVADGDAGCTGDEDCPEDLIGPCVSSSSCDCVEGDCSGSCLRTVVSHSCVGGSCEPTDEEQILPCVCEDEPCDDGRSCTFGTTCNEFGTCSGGQDLCGTNCWCTAGGTCEPSNGGTCEELEPPI